jgi:hypothetical protein
MIKWALHKAIEKFERNWKYDSSYMHDIIEASPRAAWLFSRSAALGHGKACMRIVVGGTPVMLDHGRVPAPAVVVVPTP